MLAAYTGSWWLHEASPCNCFKIIRQMRTGGGRELKAPNGCRLILFFYLDFFIPFSFPSRARTGNAVPDYLPGIKEADGGGVAVVLLLLQLQQSSTSPLPFSRHLCWSYCASFLRTKRRERDRGGATMMMTMHLPSTFVLLLCCEIEERISILQLVAHVYLCICDRSS